MEIGMWSFLLASSIVLCAAASGQPFVDEHAEIQELRTLLRVSRDQNRRLEGQMNRLKTVWTGLQHVCDLLSQPCSCEVDTQMVFATVESPAESPLLRVLSATSSGNETGEATLTVTYTALPDHATDWNVIYENYNKRSVVRAGGETTYLGGMKYNTSIVVPHSDSISSIHLNLYAENETASLSFNVKVIGNMSDQSVPKYKSPVLEMDPMYVAPRKGDLNVTFVLDGTIQQLSFIPEVSLVGLSAVKENPKLLELFEGFGSTEDSFRFSGHLRTKDIYTLVVSLKPPDAQRGGILSVRLPHTEFQEERLYGDLLESIHYGYSITIVPAGSKEFIAVDRVGLHNWENRTMMVAPRLSLMCIAMGNPLPNVQIFRELDDGRMKKVQSEYLNIDNWMNIAIHTLEASARKTPGNYTCRAESGNAVTEERTEVAVYQPVRFDEARTTVIKNTTKKVVYGCKVKGKDNMPELEFRLYYESGPNLVKFYEYQVSDSKVGKATRRITLTISPSNDDIHTVYCVSRLHGIEQYRKLELFPGTYQDWNMDLYDRFSYTSLYYTLW